MSVFVDPLSDDPRRATTKDNMTEVNDFYLPEIEGARDNWGVGHLQDGVGHILHEILAIRNLSEVRSLARKIANSSEVNNDGNLEPKAKLVLLRYH